MIRRITGGFIAILGLALVGYSGTELWDALWMGFDYTGISAAVIRIAGFDYAGPISIVAVAFLGGLLFVAGCITMTPMKQKKRSNVRDQHEPRV
ncbi:MAG TPA: hypothetical protein VFZ62_03040 [Candidatus Saccharimonadales bacterium]